MWRGLVTAALHLAYTLVIRREWVYYVPPRILMCLFCRALDEDWGAYISALSQVSSLF